MQFLAQQVTRSDMLFNLGSPASEPSRSVDSVRQHPQKLTGRKQETAGQPCDDSRSLDHLPDFNFGLAPIPPSSKSIKLR
jgi:hypothetical protein